MRRQSMKQITNKEYEEWQKYKEEKAKGHTIACFQHWILTYSCPLGNISGFHPFLMYLQKESEHFQIGQEIQKADMFDRAGGIINIVVCNDNFSIRCRDP